ncbi:TonB-linked SusC/RagA family outer membrane protein [Pedobacter sp. AK017]|uniref:SusC/RagA family TonB-linked outer membrane protein n=1 Tax=Pedobacter sp. AK017 TaxID=2723073 RepID=UPI001612BEA8|nr:TonB-dependent receptor [Pedobacter sp. AK017]MBB5438850.1 TonB-linked SusC/RagA family outer membrane protein [Pedobacter sp. AK017]
MNFQLNRIFLLMGLALPLSVIAQVNDSTKLSDSLKNINEKVSVAYGRQNKDQVTSAMASVSGNELRTTHTASLSNSLIGRLTGVSILNNGGAPGFDDPSFAIRGMHTTANNGYLVLVDGIQINSLSYIAVDEIESVTVLKDAAALAMYGVRGGNGALLVTTKRGKVSDKINISFNARYGLQSPVLLPEFANSYDYARLHNVARTNDGLPPIYTEKQLNGYKEGTDPYLYPSVNWYDEILRKNAVLQDYALTFNGGNDKVKYFLMVGYMANEGLYANTNQETNSNINFKRINFRGNIDLNITKNLSAAIGLGGNIQDRMFPTISTEDLWKSMASYAPNLYTVRSPDGQITGSANYPINPVGYLLEKGYFSRHDRNIQSSVRVNQKLDVLTRGLSVFGSLLFDNEFNNRYDKTRDYAYAEPIVGTNTDGEPYVYYLQRGLNTDLTVRTDPNYENNRVILQAGFDYNRKFNNSELSGMLMYQQDKYTVLGNQSAFAMQNLAGRFNYGFKDKYFAEFSFSYSGIENYAPGKRFGFFPALSGGWLIHKEGFWKENSAINYLKLRASAGLVGNDKGSPRFNYNQYWGTQTGQGYYFGTGTSFYNALVQLGTANPDITWEKGMIYNLGIEAKAFNSKLSFGADIYREMRSDILVDMGNATPAMSGIADGMRQNKGKVLSYGTELFTRFNDRVGAVDYYIGGQFSFARNRVKANYDIPRKEAYSSRLNRPVGQFFGLEAIGFFKNESDIISSPQQTFSVVRPGDLKYKDQNNDGIIDVNDEVAVGRHIYPEITYAFNTGIGYKGFNLDFFFQGVAHRSVLLSGAMFQPFVNNNNIIKWASEGYWTPENPNSATFPRLTTEVSANNYRTSDFWVRSANFLRLRNVELGYTLPKSVTAKLRLQSVKVFVSGLNLLTWDDLDVNVDPETLSAGYPNIKTYTAGLSVKF